MTKDEAIKWAGSAKELARLLGITHQAVYGWSEKLPPLQVYRLRELRPRWFSKAKPKAVKRA